MAILKIDDIKMDGRPLRSKSFNCPATFLVSTLFYFVNKQISDEGMI